MPAELSDAIAEAYVTAEDGGKVTWCLELRHPTFLDGLDPAPIRVCLDNEDQEFFLEADAPLNGGEEVTFRACPFELTTPESAEGVTSSAQLAIDNVSQELSSHLDSALTSTDPISVTIRAYCAGDTDEPGEIYEGLVLRQVRLTSTRAEGELTYEEIEKKAFPRVTYNRDDYPALQ